MPREWAEVPHTGVLATEEGESLQVTWDMSGAVLMGCRMAKGPQACREGGMEGVQCPGGAALTTAGWGIYPA